MKTYKIVLTGGPCGGKTDSIDFLSKKLIEQDYSIKIVNETANSLLKLGYMPSVNISTFDFQNLLFKIQFLNEYMSEGKSNILLCDRGLFDGKVYIDKSDFQKILDLNKVKEKEISSTYDSALYFRSISYEYPNEFSKKRIYESPEVGRIRDERCKEIWIDKIVPCNYDNLDGFENKQKMIYLALKKQLEYLEQIKPYKLSDYYDIEYFKYIYSGINEILTKNDIPDDIKIKTRGVNKVTTLLYFEEYESNLSHELLNRKDIKPIIIRTNKNMKFFNESYLESTKSILNYVIDYYNDIDNEVLKFKKWLKDNDIIIDYFLNDSEYYLEFSNKFARKLGLYALTDEQICWVRDKVDMKKRFREIGLDTVDFKEINSKDELKKFFVDNGSKRIIFKPRRGMNSIETYMINSLEDIDVLEIDIIPGKYMAEDFCYDHEWSIESLVQDGEVLDSYVTYIPNPTIWASISNDLNCHMTVPKIPSYFKFVPKEFIQQIVSGMNLKDGAMTIEVFISNDGNIKASELGWRLPGCQATLNHSYSYGIDIYNLLLDIAIHKKVNLKYQDKIVSVGDLYLPNKEGIIEQITPLEELLKMDDVIGGKLFAKIGEYQKKRRVGNDASGWVQVLGENEFDTLQKMQKIYDIFEIEVSNDMGGKKYVKKYKQYFLILLLTILMTAGCSNKLNIINTKDDLNNKTIGVYTGSEYDTIANDNIINVNISYYNSYSDQISALKAGKIDGFLTDEPLAKEIIKENSNLKILDEKLTEDSYAFAINPSKQDLQNEINRVLNKMKQNGKLQELEEKWMGNDESKKELDNYNYDDSKGTIKFATVSGSAPFAYMKNNKIVGYDIDVINYICKELGYKLEVIEMSFDGIIPALKSGKVDVSGCSIIVTEERKKSVLFSESDYTGGIVVITRR